MGYHSSKPAQTCFAKVTAIQYTIVEFAALTDLSGRRARASNEVDCVLQHPFPPHPSPFL